MYRKIIKLAAAIALAAVPAVAQAQHKALVYSSAGSASNANRIAQALTGSYSAVDSACAGSRCAVNLSVLQSGTEEQKQAVRNQIAGYSVLVVPSGAVTTTTDPYALLRDATVRGQLVQVLNGRVAVWAGAPDAVAASEPTTRLIRGLAAWARGNWNSVSQRGTGLVVLHDASDSRYDPYGWVDEIAGSAILVQDDHTSNPFARVVRNGTNNAAAIAILGAPSAEGVYPISYPAMVLFAVKLSVGAQGGVVDATGQYFTSRDGWRSNNKQVLATFDRTAPKLPGSVTISNLPSAGTTGGSFTPEYTKAGDGAASTASTTASVCTVSGGVVSFVAAGTCTLQASVEESATHLAATGTAQSFTVSDPAPVRAAGSVSINNLPAAAVYGGSFTPEYTTGGDGAVSLLSNSTSVCTVSAGVVSFVAAGTCKLQASIAQSETHLAATGAEQTFSVAKADATIDVDGYSGTYDGEPHGATGTATGARGENLSGLLNLGSSFTNAPGGTASWTFAGDANHKAASGSASITISRADATIDVDGYEGTYDGQPHGATGTARGVKSEDLTSLLDLGSSFTNAPGGTASWSFAGNTNYNRASGTASITINRKSVTGSFTADDKVYDGNATATVLTRSVSDRVGSDDVDLSGGTASFADKNVGTDKVVTLTGAALSGAAAGNYSLGSVQTTTADITARSLTVTATAVNKVYDRTTAATVTLSSTDIVAGDVVTFGFSAAFADRNVGTGKTVNVTGISITGGADANNYSLANQSATATASITPADVTGSFTVSNKVFDGNNTATILTRSIATGLITGDDLTLTGGTATFADALVGQNKLVTGTGFSLGGADAGNYRLASVGTTTAAISPWTLSGFYQPIAPGSTVKGTSAAPAAPTASTIFNSARAGSTIPLKFNVHAGTTELRSGTITDFKAARLASCSGGAEDPLDFTTSGATSVRYDATAGQWIQNWQTPKTAGCYRAVMTTSDGSTLEAFFTLK